MGTLPASLLYRMLAVVAAAFVSVSFAAGRQGTCAPIFAGEVSDASPVNDDHFGAALAMRRDGMQLAVYNVRDALGGVSGVGNVTIYGASGSAWAETATIHPSSQLPASYFGVDLDFSVDGNTLAVGAKGSVQAPTTPAYAYVFRFDGTSWIEEARLADPTGWSAQAHFARSVAIDGTGTLLAVGAPLLPGSGPVWDPAWGGVHPFHYDGANWVAEPMLRANDNAQNHAFGWDLALDDAGSWLAVAAPGANVAGAIYLFERVAGAWVQRHKLVASFTTVTCEALGWSLAMDAAAETIVAGAPESWIPGTRAGAAAIFQKSPTGWYQAAELVVPPAAPAHKFGLMVAIAPSSSHALVRDPYGPVGLGVGSVRAYVPSGGTWVLDSELASTTAIAGDGFGSAFAADAVASRIAIGAPEDDTPAGVDAGSVSLFELPCAPPLVYCTPKTNSAGCAPPIGFTGTASASAGSGFTISASQIMNQTPGALFYGLGGRTSAPFQGGTMCMLAPRRRTPVQFSGGNSTPAHDCSGSFAFDFNAWVPGDPALAAGIRIQAQYWSRDGYLPSNTGLTDAVDFYLAP